ncbi:MAG: TolC family protein, partial [Bacillota bacterium]|nr:TolC family protein [Bacillota bacterium]
MKNKIVALVVSGVLLTGAFSFAEVITPSISLAKQNSGYETLMLTKAKVDLTIIDSRVVENRLNATLDQFEKLRDRGMHISVMQEFPVRLSLLGTVEQIDHGIEMMALNARITEYSLYLGLRDIYMGLYQSYEKYLITEEKMVLKNDEYSMDLEKYKLGQVSDVELMQSEIDKMEARVDYVESLDNYRIMLETFNKFIGNDDIYEINTLKSEQPVEMIYENVDYYV